MRLQIATIVRRDSTSLPIARYAEIAPKVARLRIEPAELRLSVGDTTSILTRLVVTALDGAGNSLGALSAYDYTIAMGASPVVVPDPSSARQLIAERSGDATVTIAFARALWTKPDEPPSAMLKIVVR